MATKPRWGDILLGLLSQKQAAKASPDGPVSLTAPEPTAAEKYAPMGNEPTSNPNHALQGWAEKLLAAQGQQPMPEGPTPPTGDMPTGPVVIEDPRDPQSYAPMYKKPVHGNELVRRMGEPDSVYENRLAGWTPKAEGGWGAKLKAALGGAPGGLETLSTDNPRIHLTGGNYAGAAVGGAIRGLLGNLLDPNAGARAFKQQELSQLGQRRKIQTDAEKAAADIEESQARANYYNTQADELPETNRQKRLTADAKAAETLLNRIIGQGQGFDPEDPNNAELVAALKAAGRAVPKLAPGVMNVKWIHDADTGKEIGIVTDKTGKTQTLEGPITTSEQTANRLAATERQNRALEAQKTLKQLQFEHDREMEGVRQGNRLTLKQTPGAKAVGGTSSSVTSATTPQGRIPYAQIYANAESITPPGASMAVWNRNLAAAFKDAKKHGEPYDDGTRYDALTTATPPAEP